MDPDFCKSLRHAITTPEPTRGATPAELAIGVMFQLWCDDVFRSALSICARTLGRKISFSTNTCAPCSCTRRAAYLATLRTWCLEHPPATGTQWTFQLTTTTILFFLLLQPTEKKRKGCCLVDWPKIHQHCNPKKKNGGLPKPLVRPTGGYGRAVNFHALIKLALTNQKNVHRRTVSSNFHGTPRASFGRIKTATMFVPA